MQIITTKNRSRSGKPIPGRNNHPSFVVLAVVLAKELIYKMAFSIKRLRYHLPKKDTDADMDYYSSLDPVPGKFPEALGWCPRNEMC